MRFPTGLGLVVCDDWAGGQFTQRSSHEAVQLNLRVTESQSVKIYLYTYVLKAKLDL